MTLTQEAFDVYLARISPSATRMQAAQRSHNALREFLQSDGYVGRMIVTTFLNGSYARNTVIHPIKDVDIIVVLPKEWLDRPPAAAMEALRRKLAQRYTERRTLRQRRAVRVTLYDMQLDVLMAVAVDGDARPLKIPDRRSERWIETHPKAQLEMTSRLKKATGGNYTRLVRLLKGWATSRVAARDRPSSFVLECAVNRVVSGQPAAFRGSLDAAFTQLLAGLREWQFGRSRWLPWGSPNVPDPALPHLNVAERWEGSGVSGLLSKLELALKRIDRLPLSRWADSEIDKWREIFGEPFPGPTSVRRRAG